MNHKNLVAEQRNRIAAHRRVLYALETREFKAVYEKLKPTERAVLEGFALRGNDKMIREYILGHLEQHLHDLSIRELRLVASRYNVQYYSIKPKKELIDAIRAKQSLEDGRSESRRTPPKAS